VAFFFAWSLIELHYSLTMRQMTLLLKSVLGAS
jgi:hypothetical protein